MKIIKNKGEIRLSEGSYIEAAKEQQLDFREDPGDDAFFLKQKSDTLPQGITID